jgi:adenine-specific DNA-methyltransferase
MVPRQRKTDPTPVDAIKHGDKRVNIPNADDLTFVDEDLRTVRQVPYARDESLDPQLVWRGKYPLQDEIGDGDSDLVIDAPPIYIQEKIDPRVLIENLRRKAEGPQDGRELALFDTFDGLDELSAVEYYQHAANWSNRMILGDSLQVMASLAEREQLRGKVQMIYIDPPYGIKFGSNWQVRVGKRDVTDGKREDAAREAEQIKAFRDTWQLGIHSYLGYLRDRLTAARELLTDSGSCFVQIGDENVHLVRSLMDEVFGSENFCSQIAFAKTNSSSSNVLASVFDYLIWFAKNISVLKRRPLYEPRKPIENPNERYVCVETPEGEIIDLSLAQKLGDEPIPSGRFLRLDNPTSQDPAKEPQPFEFGGRTVYPPAKRHWSVKWPEGMERVRAAGLFHLVGNTLVWKNYRDFAAVKPINNIWTNLKPSGFGEANIYVVQTIADVIGRCVNLTTDPGDLVLDPTCGSGTTALVAEQWGRRWITVDTSRVALALARQRLMGARYPWYVLADSPEGHAQEQSLAAQALPRREFSRDIRHGFVYERFQHITLKSISNNPDIREDMSRTEIDTAIRRYADFELLYDKPYEDKKKVRVTGPFTVESLSPHRSLAFGAGIGEESLAETNAAKDADAQNFEQSILDNLGAAGIQNGRKNERIKFSSFETYGGSYIQAIGERVDDSDGEAPSRIGLAIGPQYGTVSPSFVKQAAREAIDAGNIDLLAILAFAFDPQVTGVTEDDGVTVEATDEGFANVAGVRKLGRIPVLMVRMNVDLLMGEELKKTGAGNLFTVFGEPDIAISQTDDGFVAKIKGIDVYDPTTGEVRSSKGTSDVALWMIDTDYNEESFFVRHCYFTGDNDPYKRLKAALRADIDADAWESLYKTVSQPFPKPSTSKIAIKVINDYGDEVMKVFEV